MCRNGVYYMIHLNSDWMCRFEFWPDRTRKFIMTMTIAIFGIMIIASSAWGVVAPKTLAKMVMNVMNRPWGLYFAVVVRIGLGLLFVLAADETRFPGAFRFLGYLMLIAAALIPLIGRKRLSRLMEWLHAKPPFVLRIWLIFGIVFGAFVVYAVV